MSTQNLLTRYSVKYTEQLLQRAIVDADFRTELLSRPEEFGITLEDLEQLPGSVEKQNMSFVEMVTEDNTVSQCRSTCISGYTIRCDGTTF
jgi:hypothetical protein